MQRGEPLGAYPSIGAYWRNRFGGRVWRVSLDAGFSCPNRDGTAGTRGCVFCDPAAFSPSFGDKRSVAEQLEAGIRRARARTGAKYFAAYFQPRTNTHAPVERLRALWGGVAEFPEVVALCVGTRPDCVPDSVLDVLSRCADRFDVWLELGLQSGHDATLRRLGRGHTAEDFADACRRARARRLKVCAHIILGLPGEGAEEEAATARFLANLGVEGLKLHQLAVAKGTPLEDDWRRQALSVLEEREYSERAVAFLRSLPTTTVLHRLVGDTSSDRLVAPAYNKGRVLRAIEESLRGPGATCRVL